MHIVLIDWRIKAVMTDDFLNYWKTKVTVNDRSKMIGEFLSEPSPKVSFLWITWDLNEEIAADVVRYINVGLWADAAAFHDQIKGYFDPSSGPKEFEYELRRRALLKPKCWRVGGWTLPIGDSDGVL